MKKLVGLLLATAAMAIGGFYLLPPFSFLAQSTLLKPVEMPAVVTFRVLLGVGDAEPTNWNGSVTATGAEIDSIRGWRFQGPDSTDYKSSWRLATRRGPDGAAGKKKKANAAVLDNGVLIAARIGAADARFTIKTEQGEFSFAAADVPYGEQQTVLGGRAQVDRVPATRQLTTSEEEQDFPALTQSGDDVYLTYVEFVHGDRSKALPNQMRQEPASFDGLARAVGGDQVKLMHYSKAKRAWDNLEAVTPAGQDIMRAAVAVDGRKRVWVAWSAFREGTYDIYTRYKSVDGKWSAEQRVTSDAGHDVNPVAVADAKGRVWVAWQGFRLGSLDILAAAQEGDKLGREVRVSTSPMSDWDPAIAADAKGDVAIAWDTYDKGDYDVYFRRLRWQNSVRMDAPMAAAASDKFEARPSISFDGKNRLWLAYEGSEQKWGKDFGAYETTGIALYQGHTIRLKCFDGVQAYDTEDALGNALPANWLRQRGRGRRAQLRRTDPSPFKGPDPALVARRAPSGTPQPGPNPRNSFPRLATDPAGFVYLTYRTSDGGRSNVGTTWHSQLVYFDGERWQGPVTVPHTDGLLDLRPSMLGVGQGNLMMAMTSDHRQESAAGQPYAVNADIYAAEFNLAGENKLADKLTPVVPERAAGATAETQAERGMVSRLRAYRATVGGRPLRLMRGEFHRHTEISGDGGGDGPIVDAYRYLIDAAAMDWGGCCDHDNGGGREYFWWLSQKLTEAYTLGDKHVEMFSYERSVRYPEGHRNVVFARRGVRPLPRLPKMDDDSAPTNAPDTQMLYKYLRQFDGIAASHTSGTDMGTDWRDNDPSVEPVVEIYQGDRQNYEIPDGPRSNNAKDSIGGWRPLGFVSLALLKGYRLGFQASSDHISTHMSYCNLWVTEPTRAGILEAFKKRRVYGATDNILADVRVGTHFMGEEFTLNEAPTFSVKLEGTAPLAKVHIIKDNNYVYTTEPKSATVNFTWKDNAAAKGKTAYYYVRGEQVDGELVWVSPMWITVQ